MAKIAVAPLVGAWIEISSFCLENNQPVSLPSWERGLKFPRLGVISSRTRVAPLVGAWIEILYTASKKPLFSVAPLVGAWIEIILISLPFTLVEGRSPRGSVD